MADQVPTLQSSHQPMGLPICVSTRVKCSSLLSISLFFGPSEKGLAGRKGREEEGIEEEEMKKMMREKQSDFQRGEAILSI